MFEVRNNFIRKQVTVKSVQRFGTIW